MRPTLLFIFLFFVLGGANASASHTAVGRQVFHQQVQPSAPGMQEQDLPLFFYENSPAQYFTVPDIEDNEDKDSFFLLKCRIYANSALAAAHLITLSRLHSSNSMAVPDHNLSSSGKYITQRTLRI